MAAAQAIASSCCSSSKTFTLPGISGVKIDTEWLIQSWLVTIATRFQVFGLWPPPSLASCQSAPSE